MTMPMLTREHLAELLAIAQQSGVDAALEAYTDRAQEEREGHIDSLMAEREDAHGDFADNGYVYGCGADDTVDSRGEPLKPLVNDAGEPWWM
jgi:hypothetical protein